tara:strand:- start:173861 stop:174004 length:144 start_codon:yes stop_codon:yes gene_type:complete
VSALKNTNNAVNEQMSMPITQAKDNGNPKIWGVGLLNNGYTGQIKEH